MASGIQKYKDNLIKPGTGVCSERFGGWISVEIKSWRILLQVFSKHAQMVIFRSDTELDINSNKNKANLWHNLEDNF